MPHRPSSRQTGALRTRFASTAARLMAQDGIRDYTQAKKKAARQLGLPDNTPYPDDSEVEAELRLYQLLFQGEQATRLLAMRRVALQMMRLLSDFRPYLTGAVLDGTAGEFSDITLQLFPDSAKEVEIFLLNRRVEFAHAEPRTERAEAVLVVPTDIADVNLVIYPVQTERITFKSRDGRPKLRAKTDAVAQMVAQMQESMNAEPAEGNA